MNEEGRRVMSLPYRLKYLTLVEKILEHQVFKEVYDKYIEDENSVNRQYVVERMKHHQLYGIGAESTFKRRASTIIGWVKWVAKRPSKA